MNKPTIRQLNKKVKILRKGNTKMSRDFRPVDQYSCDKLFAKKGEALRDMEIKWIVKGEPDVPLIDTQAKADYPELAFLLNGFSSLYQQSKGNEEVRKIFDALEESLKKVESNFEKISKLASSLPPTKKFYNLDEKQLAEQPIEAVVEEWFYGRLDDFFYYNQINDERFHDFIARKIAGNKK